MPNKRRDGPLWASAMKIVVLDGYAANPGDLSWDKIASLGELTVYDRTPADEVAQRIAQADIVFTNKAPITKESMDAAPNLKWIGILATGYNIVDVQAAREKGIPVANVPGYSTDSVAQLVFAHLLEVCHHVGEHTRAVSEGEWVNSKDFVFWNYPLIELKGKTFGILGYGSIGKAVAKIARAFGMKVIAHSRREFQDNEVECVSLDELLSRSDVLSLHCPLFEETKGIINAQNIAKMKDTAILINTARGPLINEQDVTDALNAGKLGYACIDVVNVEPMKRDNPLLKAKNCLFTPHIGWAPYEARVRLNEISYENLKSFLDGKPQNVVNGL